MSLLDLTKATVVCGTGAFLGYSFPALCQGIFIGLLFLLWLSYARNALIHFKRRNH